MRRAPWIGRCLREAFDAHSSGMMGIYYTDGAGRACNCRGGRVVPLAYLLPPAIPAFGTVLLLPVAEAAQEVDCTYPCHSFHCTFTGPDTKYSDALTCGFFPNLDITLGCCLWVLMPHYTRYLPWVPSFCGVCPICSALTVSRSLMVGASGSWAGAGELAAAHSLP